MLRDYAYCNATNCFKEKNAKDGQDTVKKKNLIVIKVMLMMLIA